MEECCGVLRPKRDESRRVPIQFSTDDLASEGDEDGDGGSELKVRGEFANEWQRSMGRGECYVESCYRSSASLESECFMTKVPVCLTPLVIGTISHQS